MFKKSKKILCFVLAFVLCISSGLSVFAAEEAGTESEITLETEKTSESSYKATLNEAENGSLQFGTNGDSSAYFESDEIVTVNVISNEGYQAGHYTVTDASGKELISEDMDGSSFSFKMPDEEIRIPVTFAAILEEKEIKISEDENPIEAENDIQNAIMNPVTSQYLSEHVDNKYTSAEKIELMNIILVKQTLADKALLAENETIDSMWESENSTEKFIAMLTTYVAVYDLSNDSDYYAAYVDTMHDDETSYVIDWCFALNDNDGNVLDNCIYDQENGIAYIPKSEYITDDGEVSLCKIQLQLLQEIGTDELESTVQTVTQCEEGDVSATEIISDMFAEGTTIQTDTGLDEDEMIVSVNGVPVTQDSYKYDSDSGQIYMEEVSSAQIQNVSVNVEDENLVSKISSHFKPYEAYALSSWEDTESVRTITLPDWIKAGTVFKGKAPLAYVDNDKAYSYTTYGFSDDTSVENLSKYIYSGSGSVNVSNVIEITYMLTVEVRPYAVYVDDNNKATTASDSTDTFCSTWSSSSQGTDDDDMDWSQFKTQVLRLQCAHIDDPLMGSLGGKPYGGAYILANCALRFLKVDRTNNYAIFAILTPETHNQQGTGIFRVNLNESGGLYVKKRSYSNTDNIIAGCKYTLYTDADCTTVATTTSGSKAVITTTDESPYSNKLLLNDGTYYMKETSTVTNYKLNSTVYTVTITSGKTITKAVRDQPIDMTLKIVKKSADTSISAGRDSYSLQGAKYTLYIGSIADVYNNDEYTGSMRRAYAWSNAEEVKTYTTDANGEITITRQPCVKNSTMFFIKETTAPSGYELV